MSLPEGPQSITCAWLTEALAIDSLEPGAVVSSFLVAPIGSEQGWVGTLSRVELTYSIPTIEAPTSVIAKFTPHGLSGVFTASEGRFYNEVAAGMSFSVPECYFAHESSGEGVSVLLLEDLSHLTTVDFLDGCSPDDAELAVVALADIHAAWWDDPRLTSMEWLLTIETSQFQTWWQGYRDSVKALLPDVELPDRLLAFGDRFADDLSHVAQRIESQPNTIIHRDIHVDNVLFDHTDGQQRAVIVDWQTVGVGKGASDVAYLLISSMSSTDRLEYERELIDTYHRRLVDHGVSNYSIEECWNDYIVSVASKMFITVAATALLDNDTPRRRAWRETDLQRMAAFFRDHNPISRL